MNKDFLVFFKIVPESHVMFVKVTQEQILRIFYIYLSSINVNANIYNYRAGLALAQIHKKPTNSRGSLLQ